MQNGKNLIFIDEINRGNVAAIFGELITLLEKDKRKIMSTKLPYSKKTFSIPDNLYVFGTMNTADRSIEALDTALRRRFEFEELSPDPTLLPQSVVDKIDLVKLLTKINERVEFLVDRDHCIGHSYFWNVKNFDDLKESFSRSIIPLLEEYFFGDIAKVYMILGEKFVTEKKVRSASDVLIKVIDGYEEEKSHYELIPQSKWTPDDFQGLS